MASHLQFQWNDQNQDPRRGSGWLVTVGVLAVATFLVATTLLFQV